MSHRSKSQKLPGKVTSAKTNAKVLNESACSSNSKESSVMEGVVPSSPQLGTLRRRLSFGLMGKGQRTSVNKRRSKNKKKRPSLQSAPAQRSQLSSNSRHSREAPDCSKILRQISTPASPAPSSSLARKFSMSGPSPLARKLSGFWKSPGQKMDKALARFIKDGHQDEVPENLNMSLGNIYSSEAQKNRFLQTTLESSDYLEAVELRKGLRSDDDSDFDEEERSVNAEKYGKLGRQKKAVESSHVFMVQKLDSLREAEGATPMKPSLQEVSADLCDSFENL